MDGVDDEFCSKLLENAPKYGLHILDLRLIGEVSTFLSMYKIVKDKFEEIEQNVNIELSKTGIICHQCLSLLTTKAYYENHLSYHKLENSIDSYPISNLQSDDVTLPQHEFPKLDHFYEKSTCSLFSKSPENPRPASTIKILSATTSRGNNRSMINSSISHTIPHQLLKEMDDQLMDRSDEIDGPINSTSSAKKLFVDNNNSPEYDRPENIVLHRSNIIPNQTPFSPLLLSNISDSTNFLDMQGCMQSETLVTVNSPIDKFVSNAICEKPPIESVDVHEDVELEQFNDALCSKCGIVCNQRKSLKLTYNKEHLNEQINCRKCQLLVGKHLGSCPISYQFECQKCGEGYRSQLNLEKHKQKYHSENSTVPNFLYYDTSKAHLGRWRCAKCNSIFDRRSKLRLHVESIHLKLSSMCDRCGVLFINEQSLKAHQKANVGMEICKKSKQNSKWTNPFYKVHTTAEDLKIYECIQCAYKSKLLSNIHRHKFVHKLGAEKFRYSCLYCSKRFCAIENRKHHMKKCSIKPESAVEEPVKIFSCEHCAKTYLSKRALLRHANKVHSSLTADIETIVPVHDEIHSNETQEAIDNIIT